MQTLKKLSPADETARLEQVRTLSQFCPLLQAYLDDITRLAAQICLTSGALLSFVEAETVHYQSKYNVSATQCERRLSYCTWAMQSPDIFIVQDAEGQSFQSSSALDSQCAFAFYAGTPLRTTNGYALGALAVVGNSSRKLSPVQIATLQKLAHSVVAELELRHKAVELDAAKAEALRSKVELDAAKAETLRSKEALQITYTILDHTESRNAELVALNKQLQAQARESEHLIQKLSENAQRYSLVVQSASDGLWDWDLLTNKMHFCPRWKALLGYAENELSDSPDEWFNRIHPEDFEQVHSDIAAHLLGLTPQYQTEHRLRDKHGRYHWVFSRGLALWDESKRPHRLAGSLTNITDQKETEQQLVHSAFHDPLTGLPNRLLFMEKLERAGDRARTRTDYLFAVLFLDLDRFKVVNDSLGHHVGDELLIALTRRLETSTRPGDIVARLGGDEFAVILDHIKHPDDASLAAERIQQALEAPFTIHQNEIFISASIGIALNLNHPASPEELLRNADTAMYRAKGGGRGRFEFFSKGMHADAIEILHIETDLRHALERQEFEVHYQPIISLHNWRISGFEALLRWQHPQDGQVPPLNFIRIAEETGIITSIGEWVLHEACQQLRIWQDLFPANPPLTISVNLSGKQFAQADLIQTVKRILNETGVEPGSLKIEITESAIIENVDAAAAILKQLKLLGIRVSLDDFGTGYSSLSYLHRFPIDTLKIDRSFVTRMSLPKNTEIIRTIVTLAQNLGMDVIAEGVETGEQIIQLSGMNCEYVQGYLVSKPVTAQEVEQLIRETWNRTDKSFDVA